MTLKLGIKWLRKKTNFVKCSSLPSNSFLAILIFFGSGAVFYCNYSNVTKIIPIRIEECLCVWCIEFQFYLKRLIYIIIRYLATLFLRLRSSCFQDFHWFALILLVQHLMQQTSSLLYDQTVCSLVKWSFARFSQHPNFQELRRSCDWEVG